MGYHPTQNKMVRRYKERHKELGLCTSCNEKAAKGKTKCQYHLDKSNKNARDRRKKLKDETI